MAVEPSAHAAATGQPLLCGAVRQTWGEAARRHTAAGRTAAGRTAAAGRMPAQAFPAHVPYQLAQWGRVLTALSNQWPHSQWRGAICCSGKLAPTHLQWKAPPAPYGQGRPCAPADALPTIQSSASSCTISLLELTGGLAAPHSLFLARWLGRSRLLFKRRDLGQQLRLLRRVRARQRLALALQALRHQHLHRLLQRCGLLWGTDTHMRQEGALM